MRLLPRKFCRAKRRRLSLLLQLGRPEYFGYQIYRLLQERDYADTCNQTSGPEDSEAKGTDGDASQGITEEEAKAIHQYTIDQRRSRVGKALAPRQETI